MTLGFQENTGAEKVRPRVLRFVGLGTPTLVQISRYYTSGASSYLFVVGPFFFRTLKSAQPIYSHSEIHNLKNESRKSKNLFSLYLIILEPALQGWGRPLASFSSSDVIIVHLGALDDDDDDDDVVSSSSSSREQYLTFSITGGTK